MVPASVLARWSRFKDGSVRAWGTGLINKTFLVEKNGERAVFQRLHPVFAGSVNEDIDAVTRHLEKKGLITPRVIRTDDDALWVDDPETCRPWRALTFIDGESVDRVDTPARARAGAALVARFHSAVADLSHAYRHVRVGVHDTPRHLEKLKHALEDRRGHRLYDDVAPLADKILRERLPDLSGLPDRHAHGDLKISNILFHRASPPQGICLVDLDTLGRMSWAFEMGDALRSWCNPSGEDHEHAEIDVDIFRAAIDGYAESGRRWVTAAERDSLVDGLLTICVELSSRFLADALMESYFGWNDKKYATRGDHNLVRARSQWALSRSVEAKRRVLSDIVRRAFS